MAFFPASLLERLGRSRKLKAYRQARAEALSDAELTDMGLETMPVGPLCPRQPLQILTRGRLVGPPPAGFSQPGHGCRCGHSLRH